MSSHPSDLSLMNWYDLLTCILISTSYEKIGIKVFFDIEWG